jgi:transcriptional regulator with PAS, ATPase and Fis domain
MKEGEDLESFVTDNEVVKNILKGLNLTRNLYVSSIIVGEAHTGKRALVHSVFPNAKVIDGALTQELSKGMEEGVGELVIENFHKVGNPDMLHFENMRVIAIADYIPNMRDIDEKFAFIYNMPPLRERPEDVELYIGYYMKRASEELSLDIEGIEIERKEVDISRNLASLRASVYRELLYRKSTARDLQNALYHLFLHDGELEKGYRENLAIFEKAILKAGLEKYGSQLKLASILGINRNTLRKKINEYDIH